jgi:PIN domain nuclease of toxin-antitoxin system
LILLDTHVLYWMANDSKRLSRRAFAAIRRARQNTGVAVAAITMWELAWLVQNGRIVVTGSVESFIRETVERVILRAVTPEIAALAASFPQDFPRDPADRLIAATAMVEGCRLVTADERIQRSKLVETVW